MFFSRDKTGKAGNFRYKYRRLFTLFSLIFAGS